MPLGKYYCDYCDKEFQDTPVARKRHLQSSSHLRAKALWFNSLHNNPTGELNLTSFTDSSRFPKGFCIRFLQTGICPYGDTCRYIHPLQTPSNNINRNQGNVVSDNMGVSWGNLPPSLRPPPDGGYPQLPFQDWG